jgi:hypothetical protein
MNINQLSPGPKLYDQVRAAFILQGATLGEWCRENDIKQPSAKSCLFGTWDGPKGRELRDRIIKESNIENLTLNVA